MGSTVGTVSALLTRLVPLYASTLQSLQLIKDPFQYHYHDDSPRWLEEVSHAAVGQLAFCENMKFLEITGFLYLSEQSARVLGRGHTKLEAVMLAYPAFGGYKENDLKVRVFHGD